MNSPAASSVGLPVVGISMGDPFGIGPEIIVKALADPLLRNRASYRVYGADAFLQEAARRAGIAPFWGSGASVSVREIPEFGLEPRPPLLAHPTDTATGGAASHRYVVACIEDTRRPVGDPARVDAIVTAPISKTSWNMAGHTRHPGHTELLAEQFGAKRTAMLFVGPSLRVILVTIHVPLAMVPGLLSVDRVRDAIELGHEACVRLGVAAPRIGVCGLNPHAGESGLLGSEDVAVIAPAVQQSATGGLNVSGPLPADTLFLAAAKGRYDLVVAMYHDQGLIPVKLLDRERAVNVTVGLGDTIRTSPAHGTAFDIAWKNAASESSMRSAIELAIEMSVRRRSVGEQPISRAR